MTLKAGLRSPCLFMPIFLFMLAFSTFLAGAAEFNDGAVRLVLHEETGRFSLYSLRHRDNRRGHLALFFGQDPRTSSLLVMVNDRAFRMGDSPAFRTRIGGTARNPSLIFESYFMLVAKEFSFVSSADSEEVNGVSVRITLENRCNRQVMAGARFLLDTNLGSRQPDVFFATNRRTISSETLLTRADRDSFWIDRNDTASLTGSLFTGSGEDPDSVLFANWKRLNEASLNIPHQPGRNFNMLPYSVRDPAVSYYFEARPLSRGERRSFRIYLFLNSAAGLGPAAPAGVAGREAILDMASRAGLPAADAEGQDIAELRELMARIDALAASGLAAEEEAAAIESAINAIRARTGNGFYSR